MRKQNETVAIGRLVCVSDVAGSSAFSGSEVGELHTKHLEALKRGAASADLVWNDAHFQPHGDGAQLSWPAGRRDIKLVAKFPGEVAAELRAINRVRSSDHQIRIRIGLASGTSEITPTGLDSAAAVTANYLCDSTPARAARRWATDHRPMHCPVVLVIDRSLYDSVVRERRGGSGPEFFIAVHFLDKNENPRQAWITLPGADPGTIEALAQHLQEWGAPRAAPQSPQTPSPVRTPDRVPGARQPQPLPGTGHSPGAPGSGPGAIAPVEGSPQEPSERDVVGQRGWLSWLSGRITPLPTSRKRDRAMPRKKTRPSPSNEGSITQTGGKGNAIIGPGGHIDNSKRKYSFQGFFIPIVKVVQTTAPVLAAGSLLYVVTAGGASDPNSSAPLADPQRVELNVQSPSTTAKPSGPRKTVSDEPSETTAAPTGPSETSPPSHVAKPETSPDPVPQVVDPEVTSDPAPRGPEGAFRFDYTPPEFGSDPDKVSRRLWTTLSARPDKECPPEAPAPCYGGELYTDEAQKDPVNGSSVILSMTCPNPAFTLCGLDTAWPLPSSGPDLLTHTYRGKTDSLSSLKFSGRTFEESTFKALFELSRLN